MGKVFIRLQSPLSIIKMVIIAIASLMCATVSAQTKNVSLHTKEMKLENILQKMRKENPGYKFLFNHEEIKNRGQKDIDLHSVPIDSALSVILQGTGLTYSIEKNIIVIRPITSARSEDTQLTVSGKVSDSTGEPLAGVSVIIASTHEGCATDVNGLFNIKVPDTHSVLMFSMIGMEPQAQMVGEQRVMNIIMHEITNMISEVVVTGYQDIKKEKMTGSVTTINAEKLKDRYTPNILDNLEGRVAGLSTYGGRPIIRGTGTLHASTSPLLVVDGLPIEGSLSDLNPYDIESINVLKDAAAAAIYGARASNGIIVITTKNARKNDKIDIDFSANLIIYENLNVDYADNHYMTPEQQVDLESNYYDYYFFNNDGEISDPIKNTASAISLGHMISPVRNAYYQRALGNISQTDLESTLSSLKNNNFARDYAKAVLRRQVLQQYNLALRGSTEKIRNNLVINYKKDNAGRINNYNNWLNIYYKGSYNLASWLTATVSINGIYNKKRNLGSNATAGYDDIWSMPSYTQLYNDDSTIRPIYYRYSGNEYWTLQNGMEDLGVNIIDEHYKNYVDTKRQNMRYHGELLFKILPGLTASAQISYENENTEKKWTIEKSSHAARSLRNAYAYEDGGSLKYYIPKDGGMLQTTNNKGEFWTARGQVNYSRSFFDRHEVSAIAGLEFRETTTNGTQSVILGYDENLQTGVSQTVDFGIMSTLANSPYFICTTRGRNEATYPANSYGYSYYFSDYMGLVLEQHHRYASGYANITYTYDSRYNIFGSFRKDYADVYGLNSRFRGKPLWSAGAGWNVHNENFVRDLTWMNFLKLRISYGVTGNIYQGATSYLTAKTDGVNIHTKLPYATISNPANPNLKWEQNRTTNIGMDFSLLNYRLRGSFDYYNKVGKDIFSRKTLDATAGFPSMNANVASIRNRGIELAVSYDWVAPHGRNCFGWTTSMTLAHNRNIVTDVETPATKAWEQISTPFKTGYPVSAIWSYKFAGISEAAGQEGQTLWEIENGGTAHNASTHSVEILEYSGQRDPKINVGMENSFRWKGMTLSVLMAYYGGHKMRALAEYDVYGIPDSSIASYFLNAWTPENKTDTPGIGRYGCQSSSSVGSEAASSNKAVHDADFIKIRNIVLGYNLPEAWLRKYGINNCQLQFQINDPKAIWVKNNIGIDPETLGHRGRSSYVFGLNINL